MKHPRRIEAAAEKTWVWMIQELIGTRNVGRILNVDETSWRLYSTSILTWAEHMPVDISGDLKESVTVLATITVDMWKLPLVILATGNTEKVESSQLGDVGDDLADHSYPVGPYRRRLVANFNGTVTKIP
jgi:hypothetical protein